MNSYNNDMENNIENIPYTQEEIQELKDTDYVNLVRFKRLIATIENKGCKEKDFIGKTHEEARLECGYGACSKCRFM